jgi:hypothetical protein
MSSLVFKLGKYYFTTMGTFFLLCAYGLMAQAPNYPYLPAMIFPAYLAGAMAMSERDGGDPFLGLLPITRFELARIKFGLGLVLVVVGWGTMTWFAILKPLPEPLDATVHKLAALSAISTLLLGAVFHLGAQHFGFAVFHKVLMGVAAVVGGGTLILFIGVAESGRDHLGGFPLVPWLQTVPTFNLLILGGLALAGYFAILERGPWRSGEIEA